MRDRTADKGDILHTGEAQVRHKQTASTHEPIVCLTQKPCADALTRHHHTPKPEGLFYHPKLSTIASVKSPARHNLRSMKLRRSKVYEQINQIIDRKSARP